MGAPKEARHGTWAGNMHVKSDIRGQGIVFGKGTVCREKPSFHFTVGLGDGILEKKETFSVGQRTVHWRGTIRGR